MSHFAGLVIFNESHAARRLKERFVGALTGRQPVIGISVQRAVSAVFVSDGGGSRAGEPTLFVSSSRLDIGEDIACAARAGPSESEIIRHIFEADGDAGIARLLGAFAFAHWDERRRVLTLARDCLGKRSLFYHAGEGFVVFASQLADLLALPEVPRELDERLLANFLALNHCETEQTFFRAVLRVPTRSVVRITPDRAERHHYWAPKFDAPPPFRRDGDYIERARELFERAVRRSLRDTPRAAVHLSGGFDSSAVAATAARLGLSEIAGYTGIPPADLVHPVHPSRYRDDTSKVQALARMHPSLRVKFITPRGAHPFQSDPARFFPDLPLPYRNLCTVGWFGHIDDAIAADGFGVTLIGSLGNMTMSWHGKLSLAALLRQGRLLRLLGEARAVARSNRRVLARVLIGEGVMPLLPPSAARIVARLRDGGPENVDRISLLNPVIVEDLRDQWRKDGFDPKYRLRGNSVRLRAHQIFDHQQIGRDMVAMRSAMSGRERRDPYGDRELIEFCLSVPETLYRCGGVERWFARQVFADRLPREILDETRIGQQAPNWFESLDARKPIIEAEVERIEASRLASRLIDVARLKRLIAEWPNDASAAEVRASEYRLGLDRAVHVGQFIRWVEGGNG